MAAASFALTRLPLLRSIDPPKFDRPHPRVRVPAVPPRGVQAAPQIVKGADARRQIGAGALPAHVVVGDRHAFGARVRLADVLEALGAHAGNLERDARRPARHVDGRWR